METKANQVEKYAQLKGVQEVQAETRFKRKVYDITK